MSDIAPDQVPISDAATIMLVSDRPDLRVLMLRRTPDMAFASDKWVFPGGRVDPGDHSDQLPTVTTGLDDAEASERLGVESGGLAWWVAACRETLEEAGVLLADAPVSPAVVAELTTQVRADEGLFVDLLARYQIRLDLAGIEEVAHLITPPGPARRFSARFFVAEAPAGPDPVHDEGEIAAWAWVNPAEALLSWVSGEFEMMSPTVRMLTCLAPYQSASEVMDLARRRLPYQRIRIADPESRYLALLPGDPGYDEADPDVELGWVRLGSNPVAP